jgi:hypothetical protein
LPTGQVRSVAAPTVVFAARIDAHDVAFDQFSTIGNAVYDFAVNGNASHVGKGRAALAGVRVELEQRLSVVTAIKVLDGLVDFDRRHARLDHLLDHVEGLPDQESRFSHLGDFSRGAKDVHYPYSSSPL